jgi:hypothetical protein
MSQLVIPRRRFLAGLLGLVAAPAVVRAASLMPISVFEPANLAGVDMVSRYRQEFILESERFLIIPPGIFYRRFAEEMYPGVPVLELRPIPRISSPS